MMHIYTERHQPATHWVDYHVDPPIEFRWPGNRLFWADCCDKRRPAKNCVVQNYYDNLYIWCAAGKGCRDPKVIKAKQRQEFRNRSAGQKRRWAKARGRDD